MDQRELHLQPLGICYRLYHFITKTLASQALKMVTLGRRTCHTPSSTALRGCSSQTDKVVRPEADDAKGLPPTQGPLGEAISSQARQDEGMNDPYMVPPPQAQPPKKMVSINEDVEEILPVKNKKKKKSRSFQKSSSTDKEEEEPKPLRSILKVGSDLNDQSNPVC